MEIAHLITGILLIGMGFLVKPFPKLIAGYNTMSEEEKQNVDIVGLSTYVKRSLVIMGLSVIVGYHLLQWLEFNQISNYMILIVSFVGSVIMLIGAQRFDKN